MALQDALMTLPHTGYADYLREVVYPKMAEHVPPDAVVVEVGVRPEDRGVISRDIIPHRHFVPVDRDPVRANLCGGARADVLVERIKADVILSTAILHHTEAPLVKDVLYNLDAPLLMFSGPTADTHEIYGDHRWHLEEDLLRGWMKDLGYTMTWERIGLTEPFAEALVVARR